LEYPRLAKVFGGLVAYIDHARGYYSIKVRGLPPPYSGETYQLLWERYGVNVEAVGGCMTPEGTAAFADGYNSVSERLLNQRFRKDILEECFRLGWERWRVKQPKG
jgi:hypothetical protein